MKRIDAGELYTHEQVVEISKDSCMVNRIISWDTVALRQFDQCINYIAENAVQNAKNKKGDTTKN